MKLSFEDKIMLQEMSVPEKDFAQIEAAAQKTKYYILPGKERISRSKAIQILGRKNYLSGLARSAFHWDAIRYADDGSATKVLFDSSNYFK